MWKNAKIVLIPKPSLTENEHSECRPIGLLSVLGKILEKLLYNRLMWHNHQNNIIKDTQFGFMPRRLAEDMVEMVVNDVKRAWKIKCKTAIISCDIEVAFNTDWWPDMILKLRRSFPHTNLLKTMMSYFLDRKISLEYGNKSMRASSKKGCIQGSVLGPLLWNLVVNEVLEYSNEHVKIYAYADDITVVVSGDDMENLTHRAQKVIDRLHTWSIKSKLKFSAKKTVVMVLNQYKSVDLKIKLRNTPITNVKSMKILGIIIDQRLTWQQHVKYVVEKASRVVQIIRRVAGLYWGTQSSILLHIYKMAYEPIVTYASKCWGEACKKKYIKRLLVQSQREILIKCLRAYKTTSYYCLLAISGSPPIHIKILKHSQFGQASVLNLARENEFEDLFPLKSVPHPSKWTHINHVCYNSIKAFSWNRTLKRQTMTYFTDGSKSPEGTGAAFVLYSSENGITRIKKFSLHPKCNVFQAELFAIERSLIHAIQKQFKSITICTDSLSSILAIENFTNHNYLAAKVRKIICEIKAKGINIELKWVRGHVGITGNEQADKMAKNAAMMSVSDYNYQRMNIKTQKRKIKNLILKEWNKEYSKYTNEWLKTFIANASYDGLGHEVVDVAEVIWMISGHGPFAAYLNRMKVKESPLCSCLVREAQTPEHLLWRCTETSDSKYVIKLRRKMTNTNKDLLNLYNNVFVNACKDICKKTSALNDSKFTCRDKNS